MTSLVEDAKNFPHPLSLTENDEGMPVFGFSFNGMCVHDPRLSDCGRFAMAPKDSGLTEEQANWLTRVNAAIDIATESALNAGCREIQVIMGIDSGDVAGLHYSSDEQRSEIAKSFANYLQTEFVHADVPIDGMVETRPASAFARLPSPR